MLFVYKHFLLFIILILLQSSIFQSIYAQKQKIPMKTDASSMAKYTKNKNVPYEKVVVDYPKLQNFIASHIFGNNQNTSFGTTPVNQRNCISESQQYLLTKCQTHCERLWHVFTDKSALVRKERQHDYFMNDKENFDGFRDFIDSQQQNNQIFNDEEIIEQEPLVRQNIWLSKASSSLNNSNNNNNASSWSMSPAPWTLGPPRKDKKRYLQDDLINNMKNNDNLNAGVQQILEKRLRLQPPPLEEQNIENKDSLLLPSKETRKRNNNNRDISLATSSNRARRNELFAKKNNSSSSNHNNNEVPQNSTMQFVKAIHRAAQSVQHAATLTQTAAESAHATCEAKCLRTVESWFSSLDNKYDFNNACELLGFARQQYKCNTIEHSSILKFIAILKHKCKSPFLLTQR